MPICQTVLKSLTDYAEIKRQQYLGESSIESRIKKFLDAMARHGQTSINDENLSLIPYLENIPSVTVIKHVAPKLRLTYYSIAWNHALPNQPETTQHEPNS